MARDITLFLPLNLTDNKACRHSHCPYAGSTSTPHHAYHGLRDTAVPQESEQCESGSREKLYYPILAGIPETYDSRQLLTESAGREVLYLINAPQKL